jgi:uncharacterized protein (DUF779 family)
MLRREEEAMHRSEAAATVRRLVVTARARRAVAHVCRAAGRQAVVMSWPAGATYLPADTFVPGAYDIIVAHIAGCAVYADVRQIGFYADRSAVLDVQDGRRSRPVLHVSCRPAMDDAARGVSGANS